MATHTLLLVCFSVFVFGVSQSVAHRSLARVSIDPNTIPLSPSFGIGTLNRSSFPKSFVFGAATSAYQIEGAWNASGKGISNWDNFSHTHPEKIADGSNADVADDSYHRFREDIRLMKDMGLTAYRFSISWSRVLPYGKLSRGVNENGIRYYNDLTNECLANGLTPYVTLFHWEIPQALEDEYMSFLSKKIIADFTDFSELCFQRFGDRVKHWITLNEPWTYSAFGYGSGTIAPGRCSSWVNPQCLGGNSGTEPYIVTHIQILAHAKVVQLYRQKFQKVQKGEIGITLVSIWFVPYSNSSADYRAARRSIDFMLGWFLSPITYGDYPLDMRAIVRKRLPRFTKEESELIKTSYDFLGLNYYTAQYAANSPYTNKVNVSYITDLNANLTVSKNGVLIGPQAGSAWLHAYPRGIYELLMHIKIDYKNPHIYVTESGVDELNNATLPLQRALVDNFRIRYYYGHLRYLRLAIRRKVNVTAYFAWSILDNYEWDSGYTVRFGLIYVDFINGLKRYQKLSAKWFQYFFSK